jgi:hypothetical protein
MKKLGLMARFRRYVLRNFWEGAVRWSPNRSSLPEEPPRDARFDLSNWDLQELIRKNRYFQKNGPAVYIRLQTLFAQYTVGSEGIKIVPATSNLDFNANVAEAWGEACKNLEISGKSYAKASEEGAHSLFGDGSFFVIKVAIDGPKEAGKPQKQPKVWLVERHRVATPPTLSDKEGKTIFNGIEMDPTQRFPVAYHVRSADTYTRYEAKDVEHVFDSTRPGQIDGVPMLAPAINLLNDLFDLQALQMKKAKAAADAANIIKRKGGEATDEDLLRSTGEVTTENSQGTSTTEDRLRRYRESHGGSWSILDKDEELSQFKSESPSVTEQWHWRKTESDVCAIAGSSIQLVYPESIQGTVQRGDIEVAAATYRGFSCLQGEHWGNVYLWWLEWAVRNDPRLKNKPEDYKKFETRPPRGPDVDVGRNSKADITEVEAGLQTYRTYYAKRQMDYRPELRQKAVEAKYIADLAKEFGIEKSEISTIQEDRKERLDSGLQQGGGKGSNVPPKKEKDDEE